jgi:hypothetical protein
MKTFVIAIAMFGAFCCMAATPTKAACRFESIELSDSSCGSGRRGCLLYACDDGTAGASCGCLIQTKLELPADRNGVILWAIVRRRDFEFASHLGHPTLLWESSRGNGGLS